MSRWVLLSIAGAIIGFILGTVLGGLIGRGADYIAYDKYEISWRTLYGGITAAVTGLIAGAGTGGLGIRTRFSLEWLLIIGIGLPLGYWIRSGSGVLHDIAQLAGIAAIACWLVVLFLRWIFGRWLSKGGLERWVFVTYIVIFGLIIFAVPPVLQLLSLFFSF